MKHALALLASLLALAGQPVSAEPTVVEVITLGYRSAEEVIPVLQPLLPPEGSISGLRNQLVVRTTPSNLETLRKVLATLDAAPRQLVVTVRQDSGGSAVRDEASVSGSAELGSDARIVLPEEGRNVRDRGAIVRREELTGRVVTTERGSRDDQTQRVQVLEGNEAFISVGESRPYPEQRVLRGPYGTTVVEGTTYRETATGFYVRPRVSGDRVTVEIIPQREVAGRRGTVQTQRVVTTVSARLGEWMEIGGIDQDTSVESSGILARSRDAGTQRRRILLKVEAAP